MRAFPGWCRDGFPLSWPHYVYGMAHLARAGALEKLRLRECFAVAQAIDQNYVAQWISTHRTQAGF